ncbi:hypothetical protein GCK32_020023, partial [Trichostrongylus colubriformis]
MVFKLRVVICWQPFFDNRASSPHVKWTREAGFVFHDSLAFGTSLTEAQAFPISPKISNLPDFGPGGWEKLLNVRITVRLKSTKDAKFVCDQLTVYDSKTRTDIDLGSALRSGVDLE